MMTESGPNNLLATSETGAAAGNAPEYTVSELSAALKRTLEDAFGRVRVRGEITRMYRASSGHAYITLKDEKAVLEGVCFRGNFERLRFKPEEGLEVICTGRISSYPGKSQYQIIIERVEPAGVGALMALLEERRNKLAAEGLFDQDRKQDLPYLPDVVGVVTSPTGAVIRDILHRLRERFPRHVLLWPVPVQGDHAAPQIAAAITGFNHLRPGGAVPRPDVLIVGRGGGSLEDLWAFNEEVVVRASATSRIPLISAVGHESDTTLIDYAADVRAPTPTAAAEFAVPVRADLLYTVADHSRRLVGGLRRRLGEAQTSLRAAARGLRDPHDLLNASAQRLDDLSDRLARGLTVDLESKTGRLREVSGRLRNPIDTLEEWRRRTRYLSERLERGVVIGIERKDARLRETVGRRRLAKSLSTDVRRHQQALERWGQRLRPSLVSDQLRDHRRALAVTAAELGRTLDRGLVAWGERVATQSKLLETLSYQNVLERGFALVRDAAGSPLKDAQAALPGMALMIEFRDGTLGATVSGDVKPKEPAERRETAKRQRRKRAEPDRNQGKLF